MSQRRAQCSECDKIYRLKTAKQIANDQLPPCPKCKGPLKLVFDPSELAPRVQEFSGDSPATETQLPIAVSPKRRLVSSTTKVILLIVSTAAASCWLMLFLLAPGASNKVEAVADSHFREQQLTEDVDSTTNEARKPRASKKVKPNRPPELPELESNIEVVPSPDDVPEVEIIGSDLPALRYGWQDGHYYGFHYFLNAELNGKSHAFKGSCRILFGPSLAELKSRGRQAPKKDVVVDPTNSIEDFSMGTGSAFLINADGYLVTCAHVVSGADGILVQLQGKSYMAQPIVIDHDHDLALIRTSAIDAIPLSIGNSNSVRLGEEVRVIGYPLSSLLDDRLTVTRGTVSSKSAEENNGGTLQVDAAINPGNSGGPVVNGRGQFVGVASSKLYGEAISNVGFAVPSNQVEQILKSRGIKLQTAPVSEELTGPDLIDRISRSVALVRVWSREEENQEKIAHYTCWQSARAMPSEGISWTRDEVRESGDLQVDSMGIVSGLDSELRLPFLWAHPIEMIIDSLDSEGRERWMREGEHTIEVSWPNQRSVSFHSVLNTTRSRVPGAFARPHAFRENNFFGDDRTTRYRATSETRFAVLKDEDSTASKYVKATKLIASEYTGAPCVYSRWNTSDRVRCSRFVPTARLCEI